MKIYVRNPERRDWMSGYGVINRAIEKMNDTLDDNAADVHLFASPPYSFLDLDPTKFNVGITMTERANLRSYKWHGQTFVDFADRMDLLIAPTQWSHDIFVQQLKPPVERVPLGHHHDQWFAPVRNTPNLRVLILDRGRDDRNSANIVSSYFDEVNHVNCQTPKPDNPHNVEIIKKGRHSQEQIRQFYHEADVLFKWGREGLFPS